MLTIEQIQPYLKGNPNTYPFYKDAVDLATKLRVHVDGVYPEGLTAKLRPHETEAQQAYRKDNFKPITKSVVNSIVVSLRKINKADDFNWTYPEMPARIPQEESLKDYLEKGLPFDSSLRNWLFKFRIFDLLADPNGVILVLPSNQPATETEYVKPYPFYFPSDRVLEFVEETFCAVESDQKSILTGQTAANPSGRILWFADTESIWKATQIGSAELVQYDIQPYLHYANGYLPALKLAGGKIAQAKENGQRLHESIISPCLPGFDLALERQSDLQIQFTYHTHSEAWEYTVNKCTACNFTGKETIDGKHSRCRTCNGTKYVSAGTTPLGITRFTPDANALPGQNGGASVAPPHKGYILKPLEPTLAIKEDVKDNLLAGMEALNVEHAKTTPLNISGEAKKVDRQEVSGFYYDVAQHFVENILDPVAYYTACMRYGKVLGQKAIDEIVPNIPIPVEFDIMSVDDMALQVKQAVDAEMDASIIFERQRQYAAKAFGKDSLQYRMVSIAAMHNPMPFMVEDDRMTVLANGGCTKAEYVLSSQFNYFVTLASEKDASFFEKPFEAQKTALYALVAEHAATIEKEKPEPTPIYDPKQPDKPQPVSADAA